MMKRFKDLLLVFLIIFTGYGSFGEEGEPEDPDVLFPSVILEIEDLSREKINAALPKGEDLLPLENEVPLPDPEEIVIEEPTVDLIVPGSDSTISSDDNKNFFTEAILGAGLQNNLLSRITFYRLGLEPVIKLSYSHESADGFDYNPIGLGYGDRMDALEGSIKYHSDAINFQSSASYRNNERGLQEQVAYYSVINQFFHADGLISFKMADMFTLSFFSAMDTANFYLTGAPAPSYPFSISYPPTELFLTEAVKGEFRWDIFHMNLCVNYWYRHIAGGNAYELHRFRPDLCLGFEFAEWLNAEAQVGIFTSSEVPLLVPFEVFVYGYPFNWLTVNIGGGYRIEENTLHKVLTGNPYMDIPPSIPDNHGWFGNINAQISFENSLLFIFDITLCTNTHYLTAGTAADGTTGLFPTIITDDIMALIMDFKMRFPVFSWLSLNALSKITVPLTASLPSEAVIGAETVIEDISGTFGLVFSLRSTITFSDAFDFPILDARAFVRIFDNMKLIIEAEDLLSPLLTESRYSVYPYISPGIRGKFKIQITF